MRRALNIPRLPILPVLLSGAAVGFSALALFSPGWFIRAGVLAIVSALAVLVYLFPATFLGIVMLSLVTSPDLFIESTIAGLDVKGLQRIILLLALAVNIYRYGFVWRSNPPITALLVMLLLTLLAADVLPFLTQGQMVRSMIALILPFLFLHCPYRRDTIDRYLLLIALMPLFSIIGGTITDLAGLRGAVMNEWLTGALRLSGMNHPATLAMFAYIAFFVCLYQAMTAARPGYYLLAGINLLIILMTGTRMPMLAAAILIAVAMLFTPQDSVRFSARVKVAVAATVLFGGAVFVLWPSLEARFTEAGSSSRDVIWPIYWDAIEKNPWFGRGIGSGTVLLPNVEDLRFQGFRAAHNEYLRLLMDGGIVGLMIYVSALILWVRSELRFMRRDESVLFLGFMVAFAVYSITDNTISAQATPVIFFALALMIHLARQRMAETARAQWSRHQAPVTAAGRTGHLAEI
jgi:O-antigen ligase